MSQIACFFFLFFSSFSNSFECMPTLIHHRGGVYLDGQLNGCSFGSERLPLELGRWCLHCVGPFWPFKYNCRAGNFLTFCESMSRSQVERVQDNQQCKQMSSNLVEEKNRERWCISMQPLRGGARGGAVDGKIDWHPPIAGWHVISFELKLSDAKWAIAVKEKRLWVARTPGKIHLKSRIMAQKPFCQKLLLINWPYKFQWGYTFPLGHLSKAPIRYEVNKPHTHPSLQPVQPLYHPHLRHTRIHAKDFHFARFSSMFHHAKMLARGEPSSSICFLFNFDWLKFYNSKIQDGY